MSRSYINIYRYIISDQNAFSKLDFQGLIYILTLIKNVKFIVTSSGPPVKTSRVS